METNSPYLAYLLRIWKTGQDWRASLEHPHTHEVIAFTSLEALFEHLRCAAGQQAAEARNLALYPKRHGGENEN
jgi:hypothetical protein